MEKIDGLVFGVHNLIYSWSWFAYIMFLSYFYTSF